MSESVTVGGATITECPGAEFCDTYWFHHSHFLCDDGVTQGKVLFSRAFTPIVDGNTIVWQT
jgi:hypothetical protein